MKPTTAIRVIPRMERDSAGNWTAPVLFLPDSTDDRVGRFIGCYSHIGQHSEACMTYYRYCTRPPKGDECADLLREYAQLGRAAGENDPLKILRRMPS